MKIIVFSILLLTGMWAESAALFGKVTHLAENDTLNVRAEPNYKAQKIGEIPFGGVVGIATCKKIVTSQWCKVYPLLQIWYERFSEENGGWVNAHYLKFYNRGYVLIDGAGNCDYALQCKENKCEVVSNYDYDMDENHEITAIKTKWVERDRLKGESGFGATSTDPRINPEGGFCTNGRMIDDYLKRHLKYLNDTRKKENK